jgi:thioredoxin-related protein
MLIRRFVFVSAAALVVGLFALAGIARAEDKLWQTDFAAAKAQAKAENKLLLVDFTGSDWCGWCKKLVAEVFSKDAFKKDAPKKFVLVELDYPTPAKKAKQSPELRKQNEELLKQYRVKGYPTILVMEADGKVIAHTGYREGGPEEYVKSLDKFIKDFGDILKIRKELDSVQGADRIKQLEKVVNIYSTKLANPTGDGVLAASKEIVALDPDNKSGLKTKYQFKAATIELSNLMDDMNFIAAVAGLKTAIAEIADGGEAKELKAMLPQCQMLADAQATIVKTMPELKDAKGLDRAKALDKIVEAFEKLNGRTKQVTPLEVEAWSKEIVTLDADNKAGLQKKYAFRMQMAQATKLLQTGKIEEARAAIEKAIALPGLAGEEVQTGRFLLGISYLNEGDPKSGVEQLQKALDAAPDTPRGKMIKGALPRIKAQMEAADKANDAEKSKK